MTGGILGLIGVVITLVYSTILSKSNRDFQEKVHRENLNLQEELANKEYDNRIWMNKYNLLIQLISYRYDIGSDEYKSAMNAISAVFHDSHEVMQAIKKFYDYTAQHESQKDELIANEKMVKVYMEIFKDLGIDQNVDEVFLHKTFNAPPKRIY